MAWFEGSIIEAVNFTGAIRGVFIGFVKGDDPESEFLEWFFEQEDVVDRLNEYNFVALQMTCDTPDYETFNSVFPDVSVPSVYFVDHIGKIIHTVKSPLPAGNSIIDIMDEIADHMENAERICEDLRLTVPCPANFTQNAHFHSSTSSPIDWMIFDILDTVVDQAVCSGEKTTDTVRDVMSTQYAIGNILEQVIKETVYKSEGSTEWDDTEACQDYVRTKTIRLHFSLPTLIGYLCYFDEKDFLSVVRDYVKCEVIPFAYFQSFDLCLALTKVVFQEEDYNKTLLELNIESGCKMLVLERELRQLPPPKNKLLDMFCTCVKPVCDVFNGFWLLAENLGVAHINYMGLLKETQKKKKHHAKAMVRVSNTNLDTLVFGLPLRDYRSCLTTSSSTESLVCENSKNVKESDHLPAADEHDLRSAGPTKEFDAATNNNPLPNVTDVSQEC